LDQFRGLQDSPDKGERERENKKEIEREEQKHDSLTRIAEASLPNYSFPLFPPLPNSSHAHLRRPPARSRSKRKRIYIISPLHAHTQTIANIAEANFSAFIHFGSTLCKRMEKIISVRV